MTNLLNIILMAPQNGQGGGTSSIIMMVMIIVVFYFFMIRPQMKKSKEQKKFRESIKKGDNVITIGGIYGRIIDIQEKSITIEVESGAKLRVLKDAISLDSSNLIGKPQ